MKKILSISLALVMLLCLCMSMTSCEQETTFGKYFAYLEGLENQTDVMQADGITTVTARPVTDDENKKISMTASAKATDATISVTLFLTDNASTYQFVFSIVAATTYTIYVRGEGDIDALSYTGNEMVVFDEFGDYTNTYQTDYYENQYRSTASSMLKTLVLAMKPMMAKADVNVEDFYFISVDFPEADNTATDTEDDLGGAFSAQRWVYVGQMLVLGMGMVFLVLAILWIILLIFEKAMGTKSQTQPTTQKVAEPTPTPTVPATPTAPQNDDAVVAAITAAIATMIASDEGLSQEFAGGFRVVSFRKKSGRGSWND